MDTIVCNLCGSPHAPDDTVRGGVVAMCRSCIGRGLADVLAGRARPPEELPEADRACAYCTGKTPSSALVVGVTAVACAQCLQRGFEFLAGTRELAGRRRTWQHLGEHTPAEVLRRHFALAGEVVTTARRFPEHQRAEFTVSIGATPPPSYVQPTSMALGLCVDAQASIPGTTHTVAATNQTGIPGRPPNQREHATMAMDDEMPSRTRWCWDPDDPDPHKRPQGINQAWQYHLATAYVKGFCRAEDGP